MIASGETFHWNLLSPSPCSIPFGGMSMWTICLFVNLFIFDDLLLFSHRSSSHKLDISSSSNCSWNWLPHLFHVFALHRLSLCKKGAFFGTAPLISFLPAAVQPHQYKCPQVSFYISPKAFYSFRSDTTFFNTFEMIMVYGVRNEFGVDPFSYVWLCHSNTVCAKDHPCPIVWPWHYSVTERIYYWDVCYF